MINSIDAEDDQFAYRYDTQLLIDRRDEDLDEDEDEHDQHHEHLPFRFMEEELPCS